MHLKFHVRYIYNLPFNFQPLLSYNTFKSHRLFPSINKNLRKVAAIFSFSFRIVFIALPTLLVEHNIRSYFQCMNNILCCIYFNVLPLDISLIFNEFVVFLVVVFSSWSFELSSVLLLTWQVSTYITQSIDRCNKKTINRFFFKHVGYFQRGIIQKDSMLCWSDSTKVLW